MPDVASGSDTTMQLLPEVDLLGNVVSQHEGILRWGRWLVHQFHIVAATLFSPNRAWKGHSAGGSSSFTGKQPHQGQL